MNSTERLYYTSHSEFTDPKHHHELLYSLPDALPELLKVIKGLLMHPVDTFSVGYKPTKAELTTHYQIRTVGHMLSKLLIKDIKGIHFVRPYKNRLILTCDYHALLLSTVLKQKGIPNRIRVGYANYLSPIESSYDLHWVCEVWDDVHSRWFYVDPDRSKVDVGKNFITAGEAYYGLKKHIYKAEQLKYKRSKGMNLLRYALIYDMNALFKNEMRHTYWDSKSFQQGPPLYTKAMSQWSATEKKTFAKMAEYLLNVDDHFDELMQLYQEYILRTAM